MSIIEQAQQKRISDLKVEVDLLRLQVRELKAQLYGAKSERRAASDCDGQSLLDCVAEAMLEDVPSEPEQPEGAEGKAKPSKGGGRKKGPKPLPARLRRESVAVGDPDLGDLVCPVTG